MGFCSATSIFDSMVDFILKTNQSDQEKVDVIKVLVEALENEDWDCQGDSKYFEHPIVQRVFAELHPDWTDELYEEDEEA